GSLHSLHFVTTIVRCRPQPGQRPHPGQIATRESITAPQQRDLINAMCTYSDKVPISHGVKTIFPLSVPDLLSVFSSCNRCAAAAWLRGNVLPIRMCSF